MVALLSNAKTAAKISLGTYIALHIVLFLAIYFFQPCSTYRAYRKNNRHKVNMLLIISQTIASLLFFYGDNIYILLRRYSQELECGEQCLDNNLKAATVTLCLSLILFQVFPHALEKVAEMYFNNYTQEESKGYGSALSMLVTVVKIDNVYTLTITVLITETEDFCTLGWILVSICSGAGVIIITIYCIHSVKSLDKLKKFTVICIFFSLLGCLLAYLLADNQQPLDCALKCNTLPANTTEIDCDRVKSAATRFSLLAITIIITASAGGVIITGLSAQYPPGHRSDQMLTEENVSLNNTQERLLHSTEENASLHSTKENASTEENALLHSTEENASLHSTKENASTEENASLHSTEERQLHSTEENASLHNMEKSEPLLNSEVNHD